jgi:RHS repeat-associated protein
MSSPTNELKSADGKQTAAQNGRSLPSISLPKGGGASRSIGEKFATNPVTGTASLAVPIYTSPGRSGFGPQLTLSYDSGAGNGPFGLGWSFSVPAITRKTDKGLPRYDDAGESDVFILSGAEDLVPEFENDDAGNWLLKDGRNVVYEKPRTIGGVTYLIRRYRPRVEGLFARIERWTNVATNEIHWRSITRDNVTTLYGKDNNSRVFDPAELDPPDVNSADQTHANPTRIYSWLICQSYDDKGNATIYEYQKEDSQRIFEDQQGQPVASVHEQNRNDATRSANRYLKRIKYGNRTPNRDAATWQVTDPTQLPKDTWMFQVVFDYGEGHYLEDAPDAKGWVFAQALIDPPAGSHWPARQDPFSTYRAGFEVRTYRLCRRVLMFHHFPNELGVQDYLVKSTEFAYRESPVASFIVGVTQSGYQRRPDGSYLKSSLPPIEFEYTQAFVQSEVREVDAESLANLPASVDGTGYQWLDLDGEGLHGVLAERNDGWYYKRNLSPLTFAVQGVKPAVSARFDAVSEVNRLPGFAETQTLRHQFLDLAGDGQLDCVVLEKPVAGFFERTKDENWDAFRPLPSMPVVDWSEPNLRFVDLDGDGHTDILITEDEVLTWHRSLAQDGFEPAVRISKPRDEEEGPAVAFADSTQSIFLADLSGDGLTDIVRIRNGEVCYWPNLGYGHFGRKVNMDHAPWFEAPDQFDQRRIRLVDLDGSGTTDIIYLAHDGVRLYFNQSGNAWSEPQTVAAFPPVDDLTSVQALDLLGNGTACLVWTSSLPGAARRSMRYIDLMGGEKPHLLVCSRNNLGAETRVFYSPSTKFYLADRQAGRPWITRLPFPVHVVERVEAYDWISRNRFVTRYAYHHGYYDGVEREFRGFGMVEQHDTEEVGALSTSAIFPDATNNDAASYVPPILTKTWFHTGAYLEEGKISRQFEHEYYRESDLSEGITGLTDAEFGAMLLPDTLLPNDLDNGEIREACRSLKGAILHQEVYTLDGTDAEDRPYSVSERNYTIRRVQPLGGNRHPVFFTHARETIDFHYHRKLYDIGGLRLADPRVSHTITLAVDDYGNPLQSVAIGYGRRHDEPDPLLTADDRNKQSRLLATYIQSGYTNPILQDDAYRTPLPCETRTYELLKIAPATNVPRITNLFGFEEIQSVVSAAGDGAHDLPYEDVDAAGATQNHPYRRLIEHTRTLFRRNNLAGPLPLGQVESVALPFETYKLAFTPGLIAKVFAGRVTDAMLSNEGGYVQGESGWWIPSGQLFYSLNANDTPVDELALAQQHFFLPHRYHDPFGADTTIRYDAHDLLLLETEDPLHNKVTAGERDAAGNTTPAIDYRVLQPTLATDPNGNRAAVAFDTLGMVVGTAVMGKAGENKGDSLAGFVADLDDAALLAHLSDPLSNPQAILQNATTRLLYDLFAYSRTQNRAQPQPAAVYTLVRETHAAGLPPGGSAKMQHSFAYSDGFGREIQKKIQADPGPVAQGGPTVSPRWVGSGWTIFNNKGKPVRQYEPFFSATQAFEFDVKNGVSPVLFYDPVERGVATLHPNHTYEKAVFDPWRQVSWDANDTVLLDPKSDADVADFFLRLNDAEYLPTWYGQRAGGALDPQEQDAATKTAAHSATPAVSFFDSLGRTFLAVADNAAAGKYPTRTELDIEGNQRAVIDAKGRTVMRYDYEVLGNRIHQSSMEAGEHWMLNEVAGRPIRAWDSRGHAFRTEYDALRRPLRSYVQGAEPQNPAAEILFAKTDYGEGQPNDIQLNLRTRPFRQYDGAGLITNEEYDFKGNLLRSTRQLVQDYKTPPDWTGNPVLEPEIFASSTIYDALNRAMTMTTPDASVIRPTYSEANLLKRVDVNLRAAVTATNFVTNIDYNAKGQRELIEYGNGIRTNYSYDPLTFRLLRLQTSRGAAPLQDLGYTYDPIGNITAIRDGAQQTIFFSNAVVEPHADYTYDATYRLITASGREHIGQASQPQTSWDDAFRVHLLHPNDGQAMRRYAQQYQYDEVGNILHLIHQANNGNWTRDYHFNEPSLIEPAKQSNRLSGTAVGNTAETYTYDAHGNMTSMPHLALMAWDFKDRLQQVDLGGGGTAWYLYDASGERVRKVVQRQNGIRQKERVYLGSFEKYREYDGTGETVTLERETLHVMDGERRIALVENHFRGNDASPAQLARYQLGNHLSSASLELDDVGHVISYEEYYPYGSTSYQAGRTVAEVSLKRYRYTGKERDEETGFSYHRARYYSPWLCRWTAPDPIGIEDGLNVYAYVGGQPTIKFDAAGHQGHHGLLYEMWKEQRQEAVHGKDEVHEQASKTKAPEPLKLVFYNVTLGPRGGGRFLARANELAAAINSDAWNPETKTLSKGKAIQAKDSILGQVEELSKRTGRKISEIQIVGHSHYGLNLSANEARELKKYVEPNVKIVFHGCLSCALPNIDVMKRGLFKELPGARIYGHEIKVDSAMPFGFVRVEVKGGEVQRTKLDRVVPEVLPSEYVHQWVKSTAKLIGIQQTRQLFDNKLVESDVKQIADQELDRIATEKK